MSIALQVKVCLMKRFPVTIAVISMICCQASRAQSHPAANLVSPSSGASATSSPSTDVPSIPPAPPGKSTIFGGEIADLDPVRDQLTLRVYGERPMKILFDERTGVYRDGRRISLRDLKPSGHASVETTLDGTKLFALSIHLMSQTALGEYDGRVSDYNAGTGELSLVSDLSPQPLKVLVNRNTQIVREGQSTFSSAGSGAADLVKGTLVSVQFASAAKEGVANASEVRILAVPGSVFAFRGKISSLDEHSGMLVVIDPRDGKSYTISFNPASFPSSQMLHVDDEVRVVADYDGVHYVASDIQVNKPGH
jgi:hypothetical protein